MNSSSFPAASVLTPGYKLDRYELLCPLAQGGMASVWLARLQGKHGFEKLVAIKTILPHFAADARFRQMFLDEARIASRIEHVNVAQILDLGEQHDVLYLVMEWVEGDSLSKLCRIVEKDGARIPIAVLLRMLADASAGLHAAHELSDATGHPLHVVHRDVSPQNILVNTKGVVKIIDFGVAKARDRHADETSNGILKGKIQYMAPEQAMGKPVDRRADVWAIGAILYRMLAGRAPFEGDNQLATLHLLSSEKPPPALPSHVPKPIAAIVRRALTHDVGERFATTAEVQQAIEAAMRATQNTALVADVAAYVGERLAPRALARKEALALALKSAAERSHIARVLQTSTDVQSGVEDLRPSQQTLAASPESARTEIKTAVLPMPESTSAEGSIGTLASASMDKVEGRRPAHLSKRTLSMALVATSVVAGGALYFTRGPAGTTAPAAQPPSAPSAAPPTEVAPALPAATEAPTAEPAPPTPAATTTAAPVRRAPRSPVARPKTEAPAPTATKKRRIDDGF